MRVTKIFAVLMLTVVMTACDEDAVGYYFTVFNGTDTPMTIHLSSWGGYEMFINGFSDGSYKFHEVETIEPYSTLSFYIAVGGNPDPFQIPSSIIPAWEYITAIEINGVSIPDEYFKNPENWKLSYNPSFLGESSRIQLDILPELIK